MEIEFCQCNWSIPGVEKLPWHQHISWWRGRELTTENHEIRFSVDWKQVARAALCEGSGRGTQDQGAVQV